MERKVHALLVRDPSESASWGAVEEAMLSEKRGVLVPSPKFPATESKRNWPDAAALPKRTVEEAERPFVRRRSVEVEFAVVPKLVVGVQGNAKTEDAAA